jgi:hypothetical protein
VESVSGKPPRPCSALPPVSLPAEASPKAISGRTSYLQVRLAFHRYPQLIGAFCNRRPFGPPRALTRASPWPWVDHLVSGLPPATVATLACDPRPWQTRFRCGSGCHSLNLATDGNSSVRSTKSTPSAYPYGQQPLTVCQRTVSGSVSLPSTGCFSPFPHGTVHYRSSAVFSLGGWSPLLPTGFRVSRSTPGFQTEPARFRLRDSHPLRSPLPAAFGYLSGF